MAALNELATATTSERPTSPTPGPAPDPGLAQASLSRTESAPKRQSRFAKLPMLSAILRFGAPAAIVLSVTVAALVLWLGWPSMGLAAIPLAIVVGLATAALTLSYAELVRLVTDMLMPE